MVVVVVVVVVVPVGLRMIVMKERKPLGSTTNRQMLPAWTAAAV